ncbi:hypothetical protein SLA2020_379460 [Shorea laevis]
MAREENREEKEGESGRLDPCGDPTAGSLVEEIVLGDQGRGYRAEEEAKIVGDQEREVAVLGDGLLVMFTAVSGHH